MFVARTLRTPASREYAGGFVRIGAVLIRAAFRALRFLGADGLIVSCAIAIFQALAAHACDPLAYGVLGVAVLRAAAGQFAAPVRRASAELGAIGVIDALNTSLSGDIAAFWAVAVAQALDALEAVEAAPRVGSRAVGVADALLTAPTFLVACRFLVVCAVASVDAFDAVAPTDLALHGALPRAVARRSAGKRAFVRGEIAALAFEAIGARGAFDAAVLVAQGFGARAVAVEDALDARPFMAEIPVAAAVGVGDAACGRFPVGDEVQATALKPGAALGGNDRSNGEECPLFHGFSTKALAS